MPSTPTPDGPTGAAREPRQLGRQIATVLADVPLFVSAPVLRHWHRRWGATDAEVAAAMPGDEILPRCPYDCTRAITIAAPPEEVWPWLVQVGCRRAGFYSNDLLDNLAVPSARRIRPELQDLERGQWVPMSPEPTDRTAFKVADFEVGRWLLWTKPDSTWSWVLNPVDSGSTRLATRVKAQYDWSKPADAMLATVLMELGDFAMMRRMLTTMKHTIEQRGR